MTAIGKQIPIDPELHRQLKIRAAQTGNSIISETEAAIRERLKKPIKPLVPTGIVFKPGDDTGENPPE